MKHKIQLSIISFLYLLFISSCDKDNPISTRSDRSVIMNTSFEVNNVPTLDNWKISDSTTIQFISFSNDVPAKTGNWSLLFKVDTTNVHSLGYHVAPNNYFSDDRYILSYWYKCVGESQLFVSLGLYHGDYINAKLIGHLTAENKWIYFCDTLTDSHNQSNFVDSVELSIMVSKSTPSSFWPRHYDSSYCLIDNIKVEHISKQ